jgi:hypothetical protein
MKKILMICSTVCLAILAGSITANAQYTECYASSANFGNCSVSSSSLNETPTSAGGWVMSTPSGNLSYSLYVSSNSYGNNLVNIWGDGPNISKYLNEPDSWSLSSSMTVTANTPVYIDVEVWAQDGSASIVVVAW